MQVDHGLLARETSSVLYMHLNDSYKYAACMSAIIIITFIFTR